MSETTELNATVVRALAMFRSQAFPEGIPKRWVSLKGNDAYVRVPYAVQRESVQALKQVAELADYQWHYESVIQALPNSQPELPLLYGNVVLISSGKGGVGKSSVTAHLAVALQQLGARVGVLDADIYGPSIPTMFGQSHKRHEIDGSKIIANQRHGVAVASLGYLTDTSDAAIWRGPMASAALQQLFRDTKWPKLDYLLVDLPPGTGDIQLTFSQNLPITGAVVVTTPQTVALADAEKGITMFRKTGVPLVGLIENMSGFECGNCGHHEAIFGTEGGIQVAEKYKVPMLGQWPLATRLREAMDAGIPLNVQAPEDSLSDIMRRTAEQLAVQLYVQRQK